MHKWIHAVQILVVQGSTVFRDGIGNFWEVVRSLSLEVLRVIGRWPLDRDADRFHLA